MKFLITIERTNWHTFTWFRRKPKVNTIVLTEFAEDEYWARDNVNRKFPSYKVVEVINVYYGTVTKY